MNNFWNVLPVVLGAFTLGYVVGYAFRAWIALIDMATLRDNLKRIYGREES